MMKEISVNTVWIVMMILTLTTYGIGKLGFSGLFITFILLSTALLKSYYVIADFMELKGVSLLWRAIMYGWLWTVCLAIAITYIISIY